MIDILKKWDAVEVAAMDVYSDMFHLGEHLIQCKDEEPGEFKANPVVYWKNSDKKSGHYRILFEDTFEETIKELQEADFSLVNGITYFGRKNVQEKASKMFAMIFDIDEIDPIKLNNFLSGAFLADIYPIPNYLILSGTGMHLYYLFEEPVPLYPNIKLQLKELKYELTKRMWNKYTSNDDKVQFQGINQGFRVIGGKTKEKSSYRHTRAFRLNSHPYSLQSLCDYVPENLRIDEKKLYKENKYTLEDAKRKFPEWYEKVIVNGDKSPVLWDIKGKVNGDNPYALYDWWKRQIKLGASYHHRYFAIMCLAIYGVKNEKPLDEVRRDAYALIPFLNAINPEEPFTKADCKSALECYDYKYAKFPIKDIEKISGISIKKNKRNGRNVKEHLQDDYWINDKGRRIINTCKQNRELALEDMRTNGEILGRPSAKQIVKTWKSSNPGKKKIDCHRETGLDPKTIRKWWSEE